MDQQILDRMPQFLDILGLDEVPMGIFYTDTKPADGFSPKPNDLPTRGVDRAVLGGWDPSARKFFKTDELSFTIPLQMFQEMLQRFDTSFLKTKTWTTVQKKITRSQKAWGKGQGARVIRG